MQFGKIEFVAEAETTSVIKTNPLIYHNEMDSSDTTDWLYFNHRRTIPTSLPRPTKPPRQINRDRKTNLLCRDATDLCSVRDPNRVASLHAGTQRTMESVNNRNTSFEVCFGAIERPIDVPDGFGTGTCELSSRRGRRRINKPTRKLISQSLDQDNWILLDPNERTEIGKKGKPIDMGIICTTKSIEIVPVPVYPQENLENPNKLRVSVPIDLSSKYPLNAITTLSRKPDVFLVKDHTPEINNVEKKRRNSTSTIHRNSILHRDCNWVKPLTEDNNNRECDHINTGRSLKTITASQKNVSKSISNLNVVNSGKSDSIQRFANSKFYVPLSEEQDNRSNKKEQRTLGLSPINTHLSASEGNLSNTVKVNSVNNKSNLEWVYCPSVLFNRLRVTKQNFVNNSSNKNSVMDKNDENENQLNWKQLLKRKLEKTFETKKKKKIQDIDGGFFERFGSLLRQKSAIHDDYVAAPLAELVADESKEPETDQLPTIDENENDSGTGTLAESDSEHDINSQHEEFIEGFIGWNIDELYEEILFEILHNVGCDVEMDNCQTALFNYIQEAFKISDDDHQRIYDNASVKEAPELRLNIEIVEAKDLKPKDPNGLADPFVTMYLLSTPNHRYNTSVKSESLTPQWEEHFSLPIDDNTANGNLVVEVWDFDPAESVKEKMNKIFDVKGVKGLRKLMKEIAQTASTGKHDNELIGTCNISLRTIPATGINMWYGLSKKTKSKTQGVIHIRLNFSSEKNTKVATSEHKHLLRILLMHELETSKVAPGWWSGKFSAQGETIITQHRIQSGLTSHDCTLAQWFVYTSVHIEHQLSFSLFAALMIKIVRAMSTTVVPEDDVKMIWEGLRKLLPSCFSLIRKLRRKSPTDKNSVKTLSEVLLILQKLRSIKPPEDFNLLPKQTYGWITATEEPNCDLYGALTDAVRSGVEDWFNHINEINSGVSTTSDEEKLQQIIKTIQLIRSDLQRTVELYDRLFQEKVDLPYAQICYDYYDMKLAEFIEPIITTMCKNMKRINLPEGRVSKLPECNDLNMGTALFELYLVLKRFSTLGSAISPLENNFKINSFHNWFTTGVTHWLDISVFKAFNRIEKAIDLDQLIAVDDTVKYSSSAVDTLAIFYQIKIFWEQLDWPDVEGSYMFVGKIVDDICKCCIFYADRMSQKVEGLGDVENVYEKKFEVTNEWCLAINNIDYVRQSLPQFVKELGIDEIINQLSEYRSPMEAERCSDTIKNVVENAIDIEKNKILELIDIVAKKMVPVMRRFLLQGAELIHQDSNSMDRLMNYLEESLTTLHSELNEVNFERVLDSIWTELAVIIYELIQSNLDKRRPPSFFANLRDTLHVLMKYFRDADNLPKAVGDIQVIEHIEKTLKLHALETAELIHQYHLYRLEEQCKLDETKYGQLTVRCSFKGNNLEVEVMNARNLCPADSNGSCDPFVRIALLPEEKFVGVVKPKTNAQSKTLFPLFDEKFTIVMTEEQREIKDAIILFSLKDKDYFGMANQYLAECFLSFDEIESSENNQIHLKLSRPSYSDIECIRALETRQGDKQAKDFLKKLKQKCV